MKEHTIGQAASERDLVILFHAFGGAKADLSNLETTIFHAWAIQKKNTPDIFYPTLDTPYLSFADPCDIVHSVLQQIDAIWSSKVRYTGIYLVGHSLGALLARKVYVCACGNMKEAPLEHQFQEETRRPWADSVKRIVLLAALNRGWRLSPHLSIPNFLRWGAGVIVGNLVMAFTMGRYTPLAFNIHYGAPFLTNLRLQWMAMRRADKQRASPSPITVQLLGSTDDLVSPQDNIDLVAGDDFYYLDVPMSGHIDVVDTDGSEAGKLRAHVITLALTASAQTLKNESILPTDQNLPKAEAGITDVVFVIHGIRDQGYWTQKIARRVIANARKKNRDIDLDKAAGRPYTDKQIIKTETSSYGYFAMLPFLLPNIRRKRVEWLMDRYAQNKALYPDASFSYVGHSHGTYMLSKALNSYTGLRFKHIAFAGSVVKTQYDWATLIKNQRVKKVVNFVASADWVVAIFPRTLQMLRLQDLGSAGHDGFLQESPDLFESEYVKGGHGAALREANWNVIANFILDGEKPAEPDLAHKRDPWIVRMGHCAPLLIAAALAVLVTIGGLLLAPLLKVDQFPWQNLIAFTLYCLTLWKVLTWF